MANTAPMLDWSSPNIVEAFKLFQQRMELYFTVKKTDITEQPATILLATGDEGLRRYNSWGLSDDDKKDPKKIFKNFIEQLEPAENHRVCRLQLSHYQQHPEESTDDFVNRCKLLANKCQFIAEEYDERIIELIIASTHYPELQRELLGKAAKFPLKDAVALARKHEAAALHSRQLKDLHISSPIETQVAGIHSRSRENNEQYRRKCKNCGRFHEDGRQNCPAQNDLCYACNKKGHWASVCITAQHQTYRQRMNTQHAGGQSYSRGPPNNHNHGRPSNYGRGRRAMHTINEYSEAVPYNTYDTQYSHDMYNNYRDDPEVQTFDTVTMSSIHDRSSDEAYVNINVRLQSRPGVHNFRLKVDTGAQANTLPYRTYKQMFPSGGADAVIRPTNSILTAYNNTTIRCLGLIDIECKFKSSQWQKTPFYVVDVPGPAVLGLPTCKSLNVVTLHCLVKKETPNVINSVQDLIQQFPDQFDKVGEFKTVHKLQVDKSVPSHIDPPRRLPIALKDKVKHELDQMEQQGIIRKIEEPTTWVSSLTYVTKRDGSLRVCLDPRRLNEALIRPYHHAPTVEELGYKFSGSKYFTKLDAKSGYWAVKLDENSQKLTTFQTPFGRYCFRRLPFGLNVSQDIFQLEMDRILEKCSGACGIADDIVVYGKTEKEHDENLRNFMEIATEHGLTLNSTKCDVKKDSVSFFGNMYTAEGMKPDPAKIADLKQMNRPQSRVELQQFLGFTNYLSKFIENYSDKTAILRELLAKESMFLWEEHHQMAFDNIKTAISEHTTLRYYDPKKPVILHCDASQMGIGAALLQPNGINLEPVAYASKSLSPCEQRYACIERELLAIVFATQRFHQFVYGRHFTVVTDHKPLVMIIDKSLTAAPPRLQRMLIALQGYNFDIQYDKGQNNTLADGLSRFPNRQNQDTIELDLRVDFIRFSTNKVNELQTHTALDPTLNKLKEVIIKGWPDTIQELSADMRPYWSIRDQLAVEDGIIMKGPQVVIPAPIRQDIMRQLHTAHLGQEKTKLLAKESVFWTSMNQDIEEYVKACPVCQKFMPAQAPEPLLPHDIPNKPWSVVGTDLFQFQGHQYLIIADYYTKYPVVRRLPLHTSSEVIIQTSKAIFAEYGIPDRIISDNGPQFDSAAYQNFSKQWGFAHYTTSPRRPQGNGFIERQIQTVKNTMKKATEAHLDTELALLFLRSTPVTSHIPSPAQMLFGRKLKTTILSKIRNEIPGKDRIMEALTKRQDTQKQFFDRHSGRELPPLHNEQQVRIQNPLTGHWDLAKVITKCDPRSYIVEDNCGRRLRRNRQHIREIPAPVKPTGDYIYANPVGPVAVTAHCQHIQESPVRTAPNTMNTHNDPATETTPIPAHTRDTEDLIPATAQGHGADRNPVSTQKPSTPTTKPKGITTRQARRTSLHTRTFYRTRAGRTVKPVQRLDY